MSLLYLCHLLKVVMAFLQCPCAMERLAHTDVFTEEGLAMVLNPVQHLRGRHTAKTHTHTHTHTHSHRETLIHIHTDANFITWNIQFYVLFLSCIQPLLFVLFLLSDGSSVRVPNCVCVSGNHTGTAPLAVMLLS